MHPMPLQSHLHCMWMEPTKTATSLKLSTLQSSMEVMQNEPPSMSLVLLNDHHPEHMSAGAIRPDCVSEMGVSTKVGCV